MRTGVTIDFFSRHLKLMGALAIMEGVVPTFWASRCPGRDQDPDLAWWFDPSDPYLDDALAVVRARIPEECRPPFERVLMLDMEGEN